MTPGDKMSAGGGEAPLAALEAALDRAALAAREAGIEPDDALGGWAACLRNSQHFIQGAFYDRDSLRSRQPHPPGRPLPLPTHAPLTRKASLDLVVTIAVPPFFTLSATFKSDLGRPANDNRPRPRRRKAS